MWVFPAFVLLLFPCPALLNPPTDSKPSGDHTSPESLGAAQNHSPLSSTKPALTLPSSSKPSQDVNQRATRDAGPSPDPAQQTMKVLISDTCIQRDSPGEKEGDSSALDLEPGSPLVLTHRISLVPVPGACGAGCEALVAVLRERMERLEREVSALREKCGGAEGGCCTSQQSTGAHCTLQPGDLCPNDCSDQGRCDKGTCICFPGYSGPDCSSTTCPSNCSDRGTCVNGLCMCESGFTGYDCSGNACPNNCNNKGQCVNGQCVCDGGFAGTDCSENSCSNNCNNNGKCINGKCVCNSGFTGTDCSSKSCPSDCSNRGRCVNGQCVCDSGLTGTDCSEKSCPKDCNGNGQCVNGKCVCNTGFTGTDCSAKSCPSDCSSRRRCVNGQCVCDSGFTGTDCSAKSCPSDCSSRGRCVNGQCVCDSGFMGTDCSAKSCPSDCSSRGRCVNGQCVCDSGFTGTDCSAKSCPSDCSEKGRCMDGKCMCDSGFMGLDCSTKSCPKDCNSNGQCVNGKCECKSGFTGPDCSEMSCPNSCNDKGRCIKGKCVCNSGFTGRDCSEKSCPPKCRNRGRCVNGQCICNSGFTGPDCSEKSCPNSCNDKGRCIKGKCVCNSGFTGRDCSEKSCPPKCRNRGRCVNGQCICNSGFTGPDCSEKSCPNSCNDKGRCIKGKCVCNSGFTGMDCSEKTCPHKCRNKGHCVNGQCVCAGGFTGTDCSEKSCPSNCNNNGRCVKGKCVCNSGFTGTDCSAKSCSSDCSNRGRCVNGQCVCDSGFTGTDCSAKSCPTDCSSRGRCVNGQCVCDSGFTGTDCSAKSCPTDCSSRGRCVNGQCVCDSGFTGTDCSAKSCPTDCSSRGRCVNGQCVCDSGFTGTDCSAKSCPTDCSSRGRCVNGQCVCDSGFTGTDCSAKSCPTDCSSRGRCVNGQCVCDSGFTGTDCSAKSCPSDCSSRGRCVNGQCVCDSGFTGTDCSAKSCPSDCSSRGRCVNGQCVCDSGFTGTDCSTKSCPSDCSSRGRCVNGQCVCDSGFTGTDCSAKSCPSDCSSRGRCVNGQCVCDSGFTGTDCSAKSCPSNCSDKGRCMDGKCMCDSGFMGLDCSTKSCPKDCNSNGHCLSGRCICNNGFTGPDCSQCAEGFTGKDCSTALIGVSQLGSRDITDSSVTVFWTPPPVQYDVYLITFTSQKEGDQKITSKVEGRLTSYNQTGLAAGQEYIVSVRGEKDGKMGTESITEVTTLISGPKNLRVVKTTTTSVVIQWEPPLADIDRYHLSITARQSEGGEEPGRQQMMLPPERDSAQITSLEAGHLYDITLVSEKGRIQSQLITVEATPAALPLPTGKVTSLDTKVPVETVSAAVESDGDIAGMTKTDQTVFHMKTDDEHKAEGRKVWRGHSGRDGESGETKVDLTPVSTGSTKLQGKGKEGTRPKLLGRLLMPKKPKVLGSAHFNGTRLIQSKVWQKQPGIKRPVLKKKMIHTAGPKPRNPIIPRDGEPSLTDQEKRPLEEVPELGTDRALHSSPGRGGNQTPSTSQSQPSPANPKMSTDTSTRAGVEAVEQKTMTGGNINHMNRRKKVKVGYRRVNGTVWMLGKEEGPGGVGKGAGLKKGGGAGVGKAGGFEGGSPAVGSDINIITDIAGADSLRKGGDDHESQREPLTNDKAQGQMQITQTKESSEQLEGNDKYQPLFPALPTAFSPSFHPKSGLPEEGSQTSMPNKTGVIDHQRESKPSQTPPLHATGPTTPKSESKSDSLAQSISPEDKGGSVGTISIANNDADLDGTQNQHFGYLEPGGKGGSLVTGSMTTDTSTGPDGTPDQHSGNQGLGDKGGSLETVSTSTDTGTGSDGTRDQHSGSLRLGDNGGSLDTVSRTTGTGTGSDRTQDRHSGSQGMGDKGGSLETVSKTTHTGIGSDRTRDQHSGSLRPGDNGGSLDTLSVKTDTGPVTDVTQDRHSGSQGMGDKGGSLEIVSMTNKANMTHKSATTNGEIDSSKDERMKRVEGGRITVTKGQGTGPLRSGRPGLRTPPIHRPLIGPFRNRTRLNLGAPHHPSQGHYRKTGMTNSTHRYSVTPQRQQGGYSLGKTNSTGTRLSPSGPALSTNGFNVKERQNYSKLGRKITTTQVGPNPNTSPTKRVGFRKVVVYSPVGTGVQKNKTVLGGSAPRTGPGFASIRLQNVTSRGFVLIWEVPHGIYQNFIVTRREYGGEGGTESKKGEKRKGEDDDEEDQEVGEGSLDEVSVGSKQDQGRTGDGSRSKTNLPAKPHKKTPKFTKVLPGSARSFQFQDLAPQTNYSLMLSGTGPGLRSKIHQVTVSTGPEPPSDLTFSNLTESSITVSWTKPQGPVSGFKVIYTHTKEGEPISVAVDSQDSTVSLSQLSPGSTYEVSVISQQGLDESDPIKGFGVTLPDPPTDLRAINVTHNKALLLWRPSLATVDRYIIVYGSEQGAETRIAVSGNAVEQQLKGLQSSTPYNVTIISQLDGRQSAGTSTLFTTAGGNDERGWEGPQKLTAKNVTPRSAVLSWKPPPVVVTGYKLTYQTPGEELKEVTLEPSVTQYKLTKLFPLSKYTVHLQGERQGQYTTAISTDFTTGALRFPFPSDCSKELLNGMQESGEAEIFPGGKRGGAVPVFCDMETDGGGWTVFQRRVDGGTNFFKSWSEYSRGFGNLSRDFWLGNNLLHNLTSMVPMAMRVDLRVGAESAFAHYSSFSVGTEKRYYMIRVSGYSGTAGDAMAYHNQQPFSTWDRDSNPFITRCAMSYRGGWWYRNCHEANLNGLYNTHTNHQGVIWTRWKGNDFSIPFTEMKIRPASFTPPFQS